MLPSLLHWGPEILFQLNKTRQLLLLALNDFIILKKCKTKDHPTAVTALTIFCRAVFASDSAKTSKACKAFEP